LNSLLPVNNKQHGKDLVTLTTTTKQTPNHNPNKKQNPKHNRPVTLYTQNTYNNNQKENSKKELLTRELIGQQK
jgi:hypothetical protein